MPATVRGALGAALLLAGSQLTVEAKPLQDHAVLEARGRCNGDNLLNRFRHRADDSKEFCQTFLNLFTTETATITAAAAE